MTQVNVRIDDEVKAQADHLFAALGLNMSTAINIFVRQAVREGRIPFSVTTEPDPFYSESNMARIRESIRQADEGRIVVKTLSELEAMARD